MNAHTLPYRIETAGSEPIKDQHTVKKTIDSGISYGYYVELNDFEDQLLLNYVDWNSSGAEVRADIVDGNNKLLARLTHGLRMGVELNPNDRSQRVIQVRMAKIKDGDWSSKYKCSTRELNEPFAEDFDATAFLKSQCIGFDEAQNLEHFIGKKRTNDLYAVIRADDRDTAIHIYVISRVLPILKKVLADRQMRLF